MGWGRGTSCFSLFLILASIAFLAGFYSIYRRLPGAFIAFLPGRFHGIALSSVFLFCPGRLATFDGPSVRNSPTASIISMDTVFQTGGQKKQAFIMGSIDASLIVRRLATVVLLCFQFVDN